MRSRSQKSGNFGVLRRGGYSCSKTSKFLDMLKNLTLVDSPPDLVGYENARIRQGKGPRKGTPWQRLPIIQSRFVNTYGRLAVMACLLYLTCNTP